MSLHSGYIVQANMRQHPSVAKGGSDLRGAGAAEMPRNSGERAAKEPRRYRLELLLGDTLARLRMPDVDLARPPGPAASKGPA